MLTFGKGNIAGTWGTSDFFLSNTQSENWPMTWDAETSELDL